MIFSAYQSWKSIKADLTPMKAQILIEGLLGNNARIKRQCMRIAKRDFGFTGNETYVRYQLERWIARHRKKA